MFRHARETATSLHRWQKTPIASHFHCTEARSPKKTPSACRIEWITIQVWPKRRQAALLVLGRTLAVVRRHEGVAVVRGRHEGFLDRARADPPDQVPHRARLVVRAGRTRAAERLLADNRAGRLVVDVEVAGRIAKLLLG